MPALDKPIEDLLLYKGSSPCPEDIDEYWDSALKEMKALDKKIEYKKAGFQVPNFECYDLYYNGVKDARIHARFVKPANIDGKIPAIVRFHGYSASASGWIDLISFASCGFCVADMDLSNFIDSASLRFNINLLCRELKPLIFSFRAKNFNRV